MSLVRIEGDRIRGTRIRVYAHIHSGITMREVEAELRGSDPEWRVDYEVGSLKPYLSLSMRLRGRCCARFFLEDPSIESLSSSTMREHETNMKSVIKSYFGRGEWRDRVW